MNVDQSKPPPGRAFDTELPLREDIGAELDDFLTLDLLGINDEARDLTQTVLWRHLRHFPVFAEVADYAIDKNDELLQAQLLATIRGQAIEFHPAEERLFLNTVTELLDQGKRLSMPWSSTKYQMLEFKQWSSVILCQRIQIIVTCALRHVSFLNDLEHRYVVSTVHEFIDRGMLSDAVRFFKILTTSTQRFIQHTTMHFIRENIQETFLKLVKALEAAEQDGSIETGQMQSDILLASIAFLKLLKIQDNGKTVYAAAGIGIEKSLKKTQHLLTIAFETLPDTTPRGQHLELCESLQNDLEKQDVAPLAEKRDSRSDTSAPASAVVSATQGAASKLMNDSKLAQSTGLAKPDTRSPEPRYENVGSATAGSPHQSRSLLSKLTKRKKSASSAADSQPKTPRAANAQLPTTTLNVEHSQGTTPMFSLKAGTHPSPQERSNPPDHQNSNARQSRPHRPAYEYGAFLQQGRASRPGIEVTGTTYRPVLRDYSSESEAADYEDEDFEHRTISNVRDIRAREVVIPPLSRELAREPARSSKPIRDGPVQDLRSSFVSTIPPNDGRSRFAADYESVGNDPLNGFSVAARVFLDKNVVTETFLEQSALYLKHNPRLVHGEDVSVWRESARSALRTGDAELSRKLIQQAYLIELSQRYKADGVDRFLRQDNAFKMFIKGSYTTFLLFLNQMEDQGKLRGSRREMLTPWARFMYWAEGEKILDTLSLPPDSVSADWAADASVESKALQPSPRTIPDQQTRSAPAFPSYLKTAGIEHRADESTSISNVRAYSTVDPSTSSRADISRPVRNRDSGSTRGNVQNLGSRPERRLQTLLSESNERNSRSSPRGQEKPVRTRKVMQRSGRDNYDTNDDEDDTDDHFENARSTISESRPSPTRPTTMASNYIHRRATAGERAALTDQPDRKALARRPDRDPSTPSQHESQRIAVSTAISSSQASAPANPITRLPRLLIGFLGQKTYRDCLEYCEDNPEIFREDSSLFQPVSLDLLRQGRQEAAERVVERWLMLREALNQASSSHMSSLEWMRRLPAVPSRQEALRRQRDTVLRALEDKIDKLPTTDPENTVVTGSRSTERSMEDRKPSRVSEETRLENRTRRDSALDESIDPKRIESSRIVTGRGR